MAKCNQLTSLPFKGLRSVIFCTVLIEIVEHSRLTELQERLIAEQTKFFWEPPLRRVGRARRPNRHGWFNQVAEIMLALTAKPLLFRCIPALSSVLLILFSVSRTEFSTGWQSWPAILPTKSTLLMLLSVAIGWLTVQLLVTFDDVPCT